MPDRLVCCGLTTVDVTQVLDRLPGPDEKVVADGLDVTFGGPAANVEAFTETQWLTMQGGITRYPF